MLPLKQHGRPGPNDYDVCRMNPYNSHTLPQLARKKPEYNLRPANSITSLRSIAVSPSHFSQPKSSSEHPDRLDTAAPTYAGNVAFPFPYYSRKLGMFLLRMVSC